MKYKIIFIPPGMVLSPGLYTVQVQSVEYRAGEEPYVTLRFLEEVPDAAGSAGPGKPAPG